MIRGRPRCLCTAHWFIMTIHAKRDAMEARQSEQVRKIIEAQAEFVDVVVIGEFEEPQWQVLPG